MLAPAKDFNQGKVAIDSGADAVYIGASRFGARAAATNSIGEIEKLCRYAHQYYAKVYVALNTLLFDRELEEAVKIIQDLYNVGIDALIIQDMALMETDLPPIPLHASTQTNNLDPEKILFLEKAGFSRVILGRELSLAQIEQIRAKTSIELESFVQGSLCVSHSGQCYLSHTMTGRSANRGECAQPCRLPYDLEDASGEMIVRNKHLLSLKDLNLSTSLPDLIDAGITSFKIEGRLKDVSYVRNVTAYYRRKIDEAIARREGFSKSSQGKEYLHFEPDLEKTFNRGYTDYFIQGRHANIESFNSPKSTGKLIGKVKDICNYFFTVIPIEQINNNDGLCFFDEKGELHGIKVNKAEGNKVFPSVMAKELKSGMDIYRNYDHAFNRILETEDGRRLLGVTFKFTETHSAYLLECSDENNITASQYIENDFQEARDGERALHTLKEQLSKLGQTIYFAKEVEIDVKIIPFIPIGKLNELRRDVINALTTLRSEHYLKQQQDDGITAFNNRHTEEALTAAYPTSHLTFQGNVVNKLAAQFYQRHGVKTMDPGLEVRSDYKDKQVMITHHCLKYTFGMCSKMPRSTSGPAYKEPFYLVSNNKRYRLEFDCKNCVMKIIY
ncbi:MAG: U32 family peptidase [Bacteroidota bacterium]|nr:U32 family peptidase [Bacteroidota bacterium]